jgi:hypothetical protein
MFINIWYENIIFQHRFSLVNHLIRRDSLGTTTLCRVPRLVVCCFVMHYNFLFYNIVAYLRHARTVTSKHVPAITQQYT